MLAARDVGGSTSEVALRFRVSASWVRRIKQQRREERRTTPKTTSERRRMWDDWNVWLVRRIDKRPDIYLREIQAALESELGVDASLWTISMARRDVRRTRTRTLIAAEQERADVVQKRTEWKETQRDTDPQRAVFIDETWQRTT